MSMRKILSIVVASLLMCAVSNAQVVKKTLQECVAIALENNLNVKRGIFNAESYQINLLQYKAGFLPTLNANASLSNNYGRNLNPVTYTYFQGVTQTINPAVSGSLTLFNGFRLQSLYKQGTRDVEAADKDLQKAKNDVILNVVTNYTTVILNKELLENTKFQLSSSQRQAERISRQVDAGALPKSNLLNQEAQVATNELNVINQENALNLSILQLKQAMQVPASTELDVLMPELALEDLIIDQTPEDIYRVSLSTMPEIKSALLKVESAQLALKAARGSLYPRISLNASASSNYSSASATQYIKDGTFTTQQIGYSLGAGGVQVPVFTDVANTVVSDEKYGVSSQTKNNLYKSLGVGITIPIFNGLQTNTNVQRAVVTRELANITVLETERTLRQSIETAYNDALSASKSYAASVKQVNAREEAYRVTKQRFDNGGANYVEYLVSENDLYSAKSDLSRAKYTFIFKKKILDFYQGKQIQF